MPGGDLLGCSGISEVLMVRCNIFSVEWIGFHASEVLYVRERGRNDAVVVGEIGILRVSDTVHEGPALMGTVDLIERKPQVPLGGTVDEIDT